MAVFFDVLGLCEEILHEMVRPQHRPPQPRFLQLLLNLIVPSTDRRLRVIGGRKRRDLHHVRQASRARGGDGVVLQLHHVFEIVCVLPSWLGA